MIRLMLIVAAAVLAGNGAEQQTVAWMKLEQARVVAAKVGRGIAVLVACDPKSGMVSCGRSTGTEKVFAEASLDRWKDKFIFARISDKKAAEELRATKTLELLFLGSDGDEVHRSVFSDLACLEKDLATATKRITPRLPDWATVDLKKAAVEGAKPVVLFVVDDRKESLETMKTLETADLAPLHEQVTFVRVAWKKDSEDAKRWGAALAPTILVLDPATREPVERASGKKTARELKALIQKALAKK